MVTNLRKGIRPILESLVLYQKSDGSFGKHCIKRLKSLAYYFKHRGIVKIDETKY
jgi:hypothetical protein